MNYRLGAIGQVFPASVCVHESSFVESAVVCFLFSAHNNVQYCIFRCPFDFSGVQSSGRSTTVDHESVIDRRKERERCVWVKILCGASVLFPMAGRCSLVNLSRNSK